MWSSHRRACTTVAVAALVSLAGIAPALTRAEERHESRAPRQEARQSHRAQPSRAQPARAAAQRSYAQHEHPVAAYHRDMAARNTAQRSPTYTAVARQSHPAAFAANRPPVVRYGNRSMVEHTIRPGFTSRTYMAGGRVLYTRTYESHVWHQYGRSFAYETFVPAVHFPAVYYGWALGVWSRPLAFTWGWHAQPWYPAYGVLFTPYPVYMSPDQWMTDYILSQNMQAAYQAQTAPPAPAPAPTDPTADAPGASAPGWTVLTPTPIPDGPAYDAAQSGNTPQAPQSGDAPQSPQPAEAPPAPQPAPAAPPPQSTDAPTAPTAAPPVVTPQIKAQLNAQIKVQLQERQAATATPATMTTMQNIPPALRPNHLFFAVVQPLEVQKGTAKGSCSLRPNDYIKRTGDMSQDDWMIPVVVELSAPSDCPEGLHTRIGLNDLNAMENEQEAQVLEALDAASKRMGPNGPPHPALIADRAAAPAANALDAVRQAP